MEYTQLINRILEAERSAQEIAQEVKVREDHLASEVEQATADLRASLQAKAGDRLRAISKEAEAARDQAIQAQNKRRDDAMARMERAYERYGDNWVDTLFRRIVGENP